MSDIHRSAREIAEQIAHYVLDDFQPEWSIEGIERIIAAALAQEHAETLGIVRAAMALSDAQDALVRALSITPEHKS